MEDLVLKILSAAKGGDYRAVLAGVLILIVMGLRSKPITSRVKWFGTDRGGAALALMAGVFSSLGTVLATPAPLGFGLILDGLLMGMTAAGGFVVLKKLLLPSDTGVLR